MASFSRAGSSRDLSLNPTNSLAGPATITRSMSRKSISQAPGTSDLVQASTSRISNQQQQTRAKLPTRVRRDAGTLGLGSKKEAGLGGISSRPSSRSLNSEGLPKRKVVSGLPDDPTRKRVIKPIGSASSNSGSMGVRRGPAIVGTANRTSSSTVRNEKRAARRSLSPAKLSPAKLSAPTLAFQDEESNPFSVNFKPNKRIFSDKTETGKKRGFDESVEEEEPGLTLGKQRAYRVLSPSKGESPAKRIHLSSEDGLPKRKIGSPEKSISVSSPRRSRTTSDENGKFDTAISTRPNSQLHRVPTFDSYPSSHMEIDSINASPARSTAVQNQARGMEIDESDDDCDLLSPKKVKVENGVKLESGRGNGEGASRIPTGLRSPMQRKRITSPLKSLSTSTSAVPVSRPSFSLSSMTFSPPRAATIETGVKALKISSGLPSKYSGAASTTSSSTIPSGASVSTSTSTGGPTSQAMKRSGIPRPAANFPPPFNPHAANGRPVPTPAYSHYEHNSSFAANSTSLFDTTISEETDEVSSVLADQSNGNMSIADETSTKLANLQAMLSRLAMPRQSMGGSSATSSKRSSLSTSTTSDRVTTVETKVARRQTMTGTFREEYTMPLSGAEDSDMAPPTSTMVRSVSRMTGRASLSEPFQTGLRGSQAPSISNKPPNGLGVVAVGEAGPPGVVKTSRRTSLLPSSASTATLNALEENERYQDGMEDASMDLGGKEKKKFMRDVVAFVDVKTLDGDDAGMIFIDMLRSMGAKVTSRPTANLTHIIYKSGRPGTITRHKAVEGPKPFLVGIGWVVRCAELEEKVDESNYLVGDAVPVQGVSHRRRKSVEPRMLNGISGTGFGNSNLQATIAASIDRARRQSLQFQPKIGSPLAKRVYTMIPTDEIDETF